jgi:hypothetical protein
MIRRVLMLAALALLPVVASAQMMTTMGSGPHGYD